MNWIASSEAYVSTEPSVLVMGNFDGVHRGHQMLLDVAQRLRPQRREGTPRPLVAFTFDPPPGRVLRPELPIHPQITTIPDRARLLHDVGVDHVVVEAFDRAYSEGSAEWFAKSVLRDRLKPSAMVVGYDFRFGKDRAGDIPALRAWVPGLDVMQVDALRVGGDVVSSSRIRRVVAEGDVKAAAALLGRPHFVRGAVVHGDHRGRTIGFPTANVDAVTELVPARGVYAVRVVGDGPLASVGAVAGVANLGVRPTFGGGDRTLVEVHLFEGAWDLYGAELRVEFIERLRDEQKFSGKDALVEQIGRDAAAARRILGVA